MQSYEWRKKQWDQVAIVLRQLYPNRKSELNYSNPWELLVAVILSAQCTDDMVNRVTERLFARYPAFTDYLTADVAEFEQLIYSTGFYRSKTRHVLGAARRIRDVYQDTVPGTMDELLTLPGVARKTANVVLQNVFDVLDGIAVDTHVKRFALRFGLSDSKNPDTIERDLMQVIDRPQWMIAGYWIKQYGRTAGRADGAGYRIDQDPLRQYRI